MTNEFILMDRIQKIQQIITKYGVDNFYISYSGGKDSCVLDQLFKEALGEQDRIKRVYIDTGIDYTEMRRFVKKKAAAAPEKYIIISPKANVREVLSNYGYPFKSKEHSEYLKIYQRNGYTKTSDRYLNPAPERKSFGCPEKLKYQFNKNFNLKVSDACCYKMKEEPIKKWANMHYKNGGIAIVGIRRDEGGRRNRSICTVFSDNTCSHLKRFQPLAPVEEEWENWYINKRNIELPILYRLGWKRTGCKGCPYDANLESTLRRIDDYFPKERIQAEKLWEPVYNEYRRIGYRLKSDNQYRQSSIFDFIDIIS